MIETQFKILITKYIKNIFYVFQKSTTKEIQTLYFYQGLEIMDYNYMFLKIDNVVNSGIYGVLENYKKETWENFSKPLTLKYQDQISELCNKSDEKKPTHIKAIYDTISDQIDFEFIYENLLIDDDDDVIISEIADEWYYEMGGPRPTPRVIPQGYHSEMRSKPIYEYDEHGRVKSITNEMYSEIVKDDDQTE